MRILYFSTRDCWPVLSGAHLRDFNLAREVARKATLVYAGFRSGEKGGASSVEFERSEPLLNSEILRIPRDSRYARSHLLRGLIGPRPFSILNYTSIGAMAAIERLISQHAFDLVQFEGVFLVEYAKRVRKLAPELRIVCDWHNIESELMARYAENAPSAARRFYARRTAKFLGSAEMEFLKVGDAQTVCSERERNSLLQRLPTARVEVIANGVDVQSFASLPVESRRTTLLFVGAMDYHANIDAALFFAREVWPIVQQRKPGLRLLIVGSRPTSEIQQLGKQPGITVTGTVADVRPFYRDAIAALVPLRVGGGTRLKVLEAMAAGTPVISTTVGAEGLAVSPGKDILIADTPQEMAEIAATLDPTSEEWNQLVVNARRLVQDCYDWSVMGARLLRLHAELIKKPVLSGASS